jgi:hypothetical protein
MVKFELPKHRDAFVSNIEGFSYSACDYVLRSFEDIFPQLSPSSISIMYVNRI